MREIWKSRRWILAALAIAFLAVGPVAASADVAEPIDAMVDHVDDTIPGAIGTPTLPERSPQAAVAPDEAELFPVADMKVRPPGGAVAAVVQSGSWRSPG